MSTFEAKVECSECGENLTPKEYTILTEAGDSVYKSYFDTTKKILEEHKKVCNENSNFYFRKMTTN